jgi:predicted Zn-dependent peptidase
MGWDQIGTKETINALNRDQFVEFKNALYTPDNAVISVAGKVTEEEVLDLVQKYFNFEDGKRAFGPNDYQKDLGTERVILQHKKTEQAHLIIGVEALPARHEDAYVEKVLSVILGGGMSSRMFSHVREQKGLSYYIRTSTDDYTDTGVLSTSAGINLAKVDDAVVAIMEEYRKITETAVGEDELNKAKGYLKGKIVLRIEDSEELAHLMGKQALLYPSVESVDDLLKKIDAVTSEDVLRLSQQLLKEEKMRLALIGPYEDKERFTNLLHY